MKICVLLTALCGLFFVAPHCDAAPAPLAAQVRRIIQEEEVINKESADLASKDDELATTTKAETLAEQQLSGTERAMKSFQATEARLSGSGERLAKARTEAAAFNTTVEIVSQAGKELREAATSIIAAAADGKGKKNNVLKMLMDTLGKAKRDVSAGRDSARLDPELKAFISAPALPKGTPAVSAASAVMGAVSLLSRSESRLRTALASQSSLVRSFEMQSRAQLAQLTQIRRTLTAYKGIESTQKKSVLEDKKKLEAIREDRERLREAVRAQKRAIAMQESIIDGEASSSSSSSKGASFSTREYNIDAHDARRN